LGRIGVIVAICALAGALAGIAGSAAAPTKKAATTKAAQKKGFARHFGMRHGGGFGFGMRGGPASGGPPVHAETIVPNAKGDSFNTVTMDNGKLKSVAGTKVTLTEGTDKATYGTPTIDVGSDARVFRNHAKATLGDLKEGDFVHVLKGPQGTLVVAESADFRAQEQKDHQGFDGLGRFGPPPGAPPPGGAAPGSDGSDGSGPAPGSDGASS
jgi:hypothetical protein